MVIFHFVWINKELKNQLNKIIIEFVVSLYMHAIDIIITSLLSSTRSDVQFERMPVARQDVLILDFGNTNNGH